MYRTRSLIGHEYKLMRLNNMVCDENASKWNAPKWNRAQVGHVKLGHVKLARAKLNAPNWHDTAIADASFHVILFGWVMGPVRSSFLGLDASLPVTKTLFAFAAMHRRQRSTPAVASCTNHGYITNQSAFMARVTNESSLPCLLAGIFNMYQ